MFSDAKAAVAKAPTDPKQFQTKLKSISAKVDRDYATAGQDIDGIDALDAGGELDKAFERRAGLLVRQRVVSRHGTVTAPGLAAVAWACGTPDLRARERVRGHVHACAASVA